MGKVEKIVVLSVLFVIVLILVVSLDAGKARADEVQGAEARTGAPPPASRGGAREGQEAGGPAAAEPGTLEEDTAPGDQSAAPAVGAGEAAEEGLLLMEQLQLPVYELPDEIPEDWALRSLAGLSDHLFDPTHKVYAAKAGDTFESLAERYYGQASYAHLLRRVNEGHDAREAGQQLLVPTHDDGIVDEVAAAIEVPEGAKAYVAGEGESLWVIAKQEYGKGHKWPVIWEANQDRLRNPDFVPEGVTLVIPALAD